MPLTTSHPNQLAYSLPMEGDGKSFVAYRLPHQQEATIIIGEAMAVESLSDVLGKEGFAFLPAANSTGHKPYIVMPNQRFALAPAQLQLPYFPLPTSTIGPLLVSYESYLSQAESIVDAIQAGRLQKAILSRIKKHETPTFSPADTFKKLCEAYPAVLVYWVSIPGEGTWLGATPETLLQTTDGMAETVALASTQPDKGLSLDAAIWGEKEQDEQQIVSNNIEALINYYFPAVSVDIDGPKTISTGALLHLKTTFQWRIPPGSSAIEPFISALHPTPAIVGQPREAALELIAATEPHDRAYYTGLIGPVGMDGQTHLFVNLRCMQVFPSYLALYVGGGITAGSQPEAEWQETELKAATLLRVV